MRNVRIFFKKKDRLKFVSHLDMNRFILRVVRLSKIPIWYTEGFNPHPYVTFALPLSLGFESDYEILDIRITDDSFSNEEVKSALMRVVPQYIEITDVKDAVLKVGKIAYAKYNITFSEYPPNLLEDLSQFLKRESIVVDKKTKKGSIKQIDLAPKIKDFSCSITADGKLLLNITLPAGGNDNINPTLLLNAVGTLPYYRVTRTLILDEQLNPFV